MRSSRTPFALLGALAQEPDQSGYDLRDWIEATISNFWSESFGQIYPALAELEGQDLLRSAEDGTRGERRRTVFRITPAGRRALKDWLEEDPEVERPRLELLLKVFFGRHGRPAALRRHVEGLHARMLERAAMLAEIEGALRREEADSPDLPYWLLTIDHGRRVCAARSAWAAAALATLDELSESR